VVIDTWEETGDILGHRPKFDIDCRICTTKMVVRHSGILYEECMPIFGKGMGVNMMTYKCPKCANVIRFKLPWDMEYLRKIKDGFRGGNTWYTPTKEEWTEESMEIARQLTALGYFGGR